MDYRENIVNRLIDLTESNYIKWNSGDGRTQNTLVFNYFESSVNGWSFEFNYDQNVDKYSLTINRVKYFKNKHIDIISTDKLKQLFELLLNKIVFGEKSYIQLEKDFSNIQNNEKDEIDEIDQDEYGNDENNDKSITVGRYVWTNSFEEWMDNVMFKSIEDSWDFSDVENAYKAGFEEAMKRKFCFIQKKSGVDISEIQGNTDQIV